MSSSLVDTVADTPFRRLAEQIAGAVVTPSDPDWDVVRQAWNLSNDQRPDVVVVPADAADVSTAVLFARDNALRIVPQGTGHLASPLGDLAGSLLLNTSALRSVEVDAENETVRVGAGVVWGEATGELAQFGLTALAGSSPDVGIAGYMLGGGYSWLARNRGLATSTVTAIDVVTADGRPLHVTADVEPDLFWALRGGGGNTAIVTSISFRVFPIADVYAGMMLFPLARAGEVLRAYEEWTRDLSDQATTCVRLVRLPPMPELPDFLRGQSFAAVDGAINAPDDEAEKLLEPLRELGPAIDTFARIPASQLGMIHMDPPTPVPAVGDGMILDDLTPEAIDALLAVAGPEAETHLLAVDLRHLGGAVGVPAPDGGAIDHLPGRFLLYAVGVTPDAESAAAMQVDVDGIRDALAPWANPLDYSNFREVKTDPSRFYSAETLERLRAVKNRYDPDRVIRTSHELF
ncbi:FAD-binding oxidoreductase [Leifsonia sp. NPDC058248]|uniref:FAD-binding oxidoreductase n=1 Tax=Leifsonia sp. NPDC058248 TaxID=3346402 RepID=UPI0036DFA383